MSLPNIHNEQTPEEREMIAVMHSLQRTKETFDEDAPRSLGYVFHFEVPKPWAAAFTAMGCDVKVWEPKEEAAPKIMTRLSCDMYPKFNYKKLMLKFMALIWRVDGQILPKKIDEKLKFFTDRYYGRDRDDITAKLTNGVHWTIEEAREFQRLSHEINTNRKKYE